MNELEKLKEESFKQMKEFHANLRSENISFWSKIVTINLAILGFSFTLFSTDSLNYQIFCSFAKYPLVLSWILFLVSVISYFVLIKKEQKFSSEEKLRESFYAEDLCQFVNESDKLSALTILHQKRIPGTSDLLNNEESHATFNNNKAGLKSYKMIKNPDDFYSDKHKKVIDCLENSFYVISIIALISLMASVIILIF